RAIHLVSPVRRVAIGRQQEEPARHALLGVRRHPDAQPQERARRSREAEALLRQALERDLRAPAPAPWVDRPALLHRLGDALWDQGKPLEAEPYLRQALQQRLSRLGPDALAVAQSRTTLGLVLQDLGRLDDAEKELREAGRVWLKLLGKRDMSYLVNLNNLAGLATRRRDYAAAAELYREALEAAGEALPPGHPRLAFLLLGLGGSLAELGRTGEGEPFIRRALELRRSTLGADHWLTGWTELVLGGCLGMEGRFAAGEPLVLEGWKVMRSSRPLDDPETARARQRVENFYQTWGRPVPALSP
nr:tetratricopeptide repeat protein [Thermoanaerobaculia bacterium]